MKMSPCRAHRAAVVLAAAQRHGCTGYRGSLMFGSTLCSTNIAYQSRKISAVHKRRL
jgi:hypothetical protein